MGAHIYSDDYLGCNISLWDDSWGEYTYLYKSELHAMYSIQHLAFDSFDCCLTRRILPLDREIAMARSSPINRYRNFDSGVFPRPFTQRSSVPT